MTDYSRPLRVGIPEPGTGRPSVELISPPSGEAPTMGPLRNGPQRHVPEPFGAHHLSRYGYSQPYIMSTGHSPLIMDTLSGIPCGSNPVIPRPGTSDTTTPPPGSLASPAHNRTSSPRSSPVNSLGTKSTNFHNIADLIGGSRSSQFPSAGKSPEQQCSRECIKQQTTPTSNPRPGKHFLLCFFHFRVTFIRSSIAKYKSLEFSMNNFKNKVSLYMYTPS